MLSAQALVSQLARNWVLYSAKHWEPFRTTLGAELGSVLGTAERSGLGEVLGGAEGHDVGVALGA